MHHTQIQMKLQFIAGRREEMGNPEWRLKFGRRKLPPMSLYAQETLQSAEKKRRQLPKNRPRGRNQRPLRKQQEDCSARYWDTNRKTREEEMDARDSSFGRPCFHHCGGKWHLSILPTLCPLCPHANFHHRNSFARYLIHIMTE